MTRARVASKAGATSAQVKPERVSLRALYAEAMKEVMADPRKAITEHDPWLAALLPAAPVLPSKG